MRWATRAGVHIDRAACAWLIRRFLDPEAEERAKKLTRDEGGDSNSRFADLYLRAGFVEDALRCLAAAADSTERTRALRRLRSEWRAINRRDFFPPPEREVAAAALRDLAAVAAGDSAPAAEVTEAAR